MEKESSAVFKWSYSLNSNMIPRILSLFEKWVALTSTTGQNVFLSAIIP